MNDESATKDTPRKPPTSRPLDFEERKKIHKLISHGFSSLRISEMIGRGRNTVNVEIRRNGGKSAYDAAKAQEAADNRASLKVPNMKRSLEHHVSLNRAEVKRMHEEGYAIWDIKRTLKISHISIQKHLKELGIKKYNVIDFMEIMDNKIESIENQIEIILKKLGERT